MEPSTDRRKKSDKARDTHDKYGGKSSRHVRIAEAQAAAHQAKPEAKKPKTK